MPTNEIAGNETIAGEALSAKGVAWAGGDGDGAGRRGLLAARDLVSGHQFPIVWEAAAVNSVTSPPPRRRA